MSPAWRLFEAVRIARRGESQILQPDDFLKQTLELFETRLDPRGSSRAAVCPPTPRAVLEQGPQAAAFEAPGEFPERSAAHGVPPRFAARQTTTMVGVCTAHAEAGKGQFCNRYRRGPIVRLPIQATSGSGTFTVPSAFWWFSRIAMIARLIATAVPLRVWTNCVPFSPGLR